MGLTKLIRTDNEKLFREQVLDKIDEEDLGTMVDMISIYKNTGEMIPIDDLRYVGIKILRPIMGSDNDIEANAQAMSFIQKPDYYLIETDHSVNVAVYWLNAKKR